MWRKELTRFARGQLKDGPAAAPPFVFRGQANYTPRLQNALASLDSLLDWENTDRIRGAQRAMRVDSSPSARILDALGNPQNQFRSVHITGSKGKGSVARMVIAGASQYVEKTGWYASPHVERINERVGIAGAPICDDRLAYSLECALEAAAAHSPSATFFDVLTAAGFHAMASSGVSLAAVEVGMGGSRDSTNVLPKGGICLLTNIHGTEHAEIIGPTSVDIAREKAGIAASEGALLLTTVHHEGEIAQELRDVVENAGATVRFVGHNDENHGSVQETNAKLAEEALREMDLRGWLGDGEKSSKFLTQESIKHAMTGFPARMEKFLLEGQSAVLLDGAHTPQAVEQLLDSVSKYPKVTVVLALGKDKDANGILRALGARKSIRRIVCTQTGTESVYLQASDLFRASEKAGVGAICEQVDDPVAAVERGMLSAVDGLCLVTGSLHFAGVVRPRIRLLSSSRIVT